MLIYVAHRLILAIVTMFVISMISFVIIQLPPGDYVSAYVAQMEASGNPISKKIAENLRKQYGLGQPIYVQYFKWITRIILHGDFGISMERSQKVTEVIGGRLGLTVVVSMSAFLFTWLVALPIGIFSAVRQYSSGDYIATFIAFIGLSIPNFLLAIVLMFLGWHFFNTDMGGLFSLEYLTASWSLPKVWDMVKHLWLPVVVLGTAGTAGSMRIMRANLLDELNKPFIMTARAKGLPETRLIIKYPVRVALNPFVSRLGFVLSQIVAGDVIVSLVLGLPTMGPLLYSALLSQDMYLAGAIILLLSSLTVIGVLLSDLLLAWLDPRIRFEGRE